jgi:hypothetical protein
MADPQQTTEFVLGQVCAKLDDIHMMVHRQDDRIAEAIKDLHVKDQEQEAKILSLISWRSKVRGMFVVVVGLPAVAISLLKLFGITILGL